MSILELGNHHPKGRLVGSGPGDDRSLGLVVMEDDIAIGDFTDKRVAPVLRFVVARLGRF